MSHPPTPPRVIAIGGAGIKVASRLKENALQDFDTQGFDLGATAAPFPVFCVGTGALEFFGSGGDPEVTRRAAEEKRAEIEAVFHGASVVFIIAGLGGGTASALAPLVAQAAIKAGALVFAFVGLPFVQEGARRAAQAKEALSELRATGATVIPLPGDILLRAAAPDSTPTQVLQQADHTIGRAIRGLAGMLYTPGLTEVDFPAFQQSFLQSKNGKTLFSLAEATGPAALTQLYNELTSCALLQATEVARSADHLTLALKLSSDIGLKEIQQLSDQLCDKFGIRHHKFIGALVVPEWTQTRIEAVLLGQPDPETRRKQSAALQSAQNSSKNVKSKPALPSNAQTEFSFNSAIEQRGFFEHTELNLYRGEDVDVPTYLRRGVKVVL